MYRGLFFFSICFYFVKKIIFPIKWKKIDPPPTIQNESIPFVDEDWGQFIDIDIY